MIILDSTHKLLEVTLAAPVTTNQLPTVAGFVDINQQTSALTGTIEADNQTNNTAYATVVPAPASLFSRMIRYFSVQNADTVAATVTVDLNNNGTRRTIWRGTLDPNDTLLYDESHGLNVINATGQVKTSGSTQYQTGSTSAPVIGTVGMGVVADALPDYVPGQVRPGSLTPLGALRVAFERPVGNPFAVGRHPFRARPIWIGSVW